MGQHLTKEGLNPDPIKVKAILDMPTPDSKKAVECFLGCLQYLSHFLPQLAAIAAPCDNSWNDQPSSQGKHNKQMHFNP